MDSSDYSKNYELLLEELKADDVLLEIPQVLKEEIIEESKRLSKIRSEIERLVTFIDLTTLMGDDTKSRVDDLVNSAINPVKENLQIKCASVCVYPARILDACSAIKANGSSLNIASVAGGFPSGQYHIECRLLEIQLAIRDGATEIDSVLNRAAILENNWKLLFEELVRIREAAKGVKLKIILSVGELGSNKAIHLASMAAMYSDCIEITENVNLKLEYNFNLSSLISRETFFMNIFKITFLIFGADFIKTSTGKETINATLESAYIMCSAIAQFYKNTNKKVGFKAAGGIRSVEQALQYMILFEKILGENNLDPKLFRIGASMGLLENIKEKLSDDKLI
uniref:deoxyribose-phosphate aldolase n=1 Tax=Meloidogyne javanica TaxID=6303 RepID=A0A915LUX6_MELJA